MRIDVFEQTIGAGVRVQVDADAGESKEMRDDGWKRACGDRSRTTVGG